MAAFWIVLCFASVIYAKDAVSVKPDGSNAAVEEIFGTKRVGDYFGGPKHVSAVSETTPAVCSSYGTNCEFHMYEDSPDFITSVTRYCRCPEGSTCERVKNYMSQKTWIHRCLRSKTETITQPMRSNEATTEKVEALKSDRSKRGSDFETGDNSKAENQEGISARKSNAFQKRGGNPKDEL